MRNRFFSILLSCLVIMFITSTAEASSLFSVSSNTGYPKPYDATNRLEKESPLYIDEDGDAVYRDPEPTDADDIVENFEEKYNVSIKETLYSPLYCIQSVLLLLFIIDLVLLIPFVIKLIKVQSIRNYSFSRYQRLLILFYPILLGALVAFSVLNRLLYY